MFVFLFNFLHFFYMVDIVRFAWRFASDISFFSVSLFTVRFFLCIFVCKLSNNVLFYRICCSLFLLLSLCVVVSNSMLRRICMLCLMLVSFSVVRRIFSFFVSVLLLSQVFLLPKLVPPVLCFSCSSSRGCSVWSALWSFSVLVFFLSSTCLAFFFCDCRHIFGYQ